MKQLLSFLTGLLLLPGLLFSWNGEAWQPMTRQMIISRARLMIESRWSPNKKCRGWNSSISPGEFEPNSKYFGLLYTQHTSFQSGPGSRAQNNWTEFYEGITHLPYDYYGFWSGDQWFNYYGSDCSGFVSVCWGMPSRYSTRTFHSEANGAQQYCYPLGPVGSVASVELLPGDAINQEGVHIILFSRKLETNKIESLEQTTNNAKKREYYYSSLSSCQPIRRHNLMDAAESSVDLQDVPEQIKAGASFAVTAELFVADGQTSADVYLEMRDGKSEALLTLRTETGVGAGNQTVSFSDLSLPLQQDSYSAYFICYLTPPGGTKDSPLAFATTVETPSMVVAKKARPKR